ncbi:CinA family protein [bacterium]|nr:CinA family protein [bacterium]
MLKELTKEVHELLIKSRYKISFAESCTGGLLQKLITDNSGSSSYYEGGIVAYSDRVKKDLLSVPQNILSANGAVSAECALAMVMGIKRLTQADLCISITGIAGPTGGSKKKPVGTVWFGFDFAGEINIESECFSGKREEVRAQAAIYVLEEIKKYLTRG